MGMMEILTARIMGNIIINIVMKPWKPMSIPILMNIMYRKPMETVIYIQKRCIPTTDTITMNTVALTRSWRLSTMQI